MEYNNLKNSFLGVVLVYLVLFENANCMELENHSVFYGLTLTAAKKINKNSCERELGTIKRGIDDRKRWALKLMDASGTPNTGLYWGNVFWLGSRRQCMAAASLKRVPVNRTEGFNTVETKETIPPFSVAYYAAYFRHNSTMQVFVHWDNEVTITLGLCLPSSCTENELSKLLQEYFDSGKLYHQNVYDMSLKMEGVKKTEDDFSWTDETLFKIFACSVTLILLLCVLGTTYDITIYRSSVEKIKLNHVAHLMNNLGHKNCGTGRKAEMTKDENLWNLSHFPEPEINFTSKMLRCFSVVNNAKSVFKMPENQDSGKNMLSINGLRIVTTFWIVMNHSVFYVADYLYNRTAAYSISELMPIQAFSNASFTVDTFVCVSGFLLGYSFLEIEKKKAKDGIKESMMKKLALVPVGTFFRILRLLPAYLVALGFSYTLSAVRHRETAFFTAERNDINCVQYWWRNLLFINNLYPKAEMCMSWSWYLSSDLQNFILTMVLLVLATSYLKPVIYAIVAMFVLANAYTGYLAYSVGFTPFIDNMWTYFDLLYDRPWTRIGPYFVGLAGGCFLQHCNRILPFNKPALGLCWAIGIGTGTMIMFGFSDKDMAPISSVLYAALSRSAWALSVTWLMLACLSGNGGFIEKFLSLKLWIPIARVTYCIYLINPLVIRTFGTFNDSPWEVGVHTAIISGLGFVMATLILGFVFSIIFEAPFFQLTKLLTGENKPNKKIKKNIHNTINNNVETKKVS